jgi:division protein CdvB (Snf7/Vps24/ESCRT-III family)
MYKRYLQVNKISKTMDQFEEQFLNMDVASAYMDSTMQSTTAMSTPPDQVDALIQLVADEAGLQLGAQVDSAGTVGRVIPQAAVPQSAGLQLLILNFLNNVLLSLLTITNYIHLLLDVCNSCSRG